MIYSRKIILILVVNIFISVNGINLNDVESSEKLRIRKYPGYCINTFILTPSDNDIINHLVNNKSEIWNGFDTERMVEAWAYEKGEKILLIDLFVSDPNGFRSNHNIALIRGNWREIDFVKFHLILRDLRLNSRPLFDIEQSNDQNYDPCKELDQIANRNGVTDSEEQQESCFTKIFCQIATCFM